MKLTSKVSKDTSDPTITGYFLSSRGSVNCSRKPCFSEFWVSGKHEMGTAVEEQPQCLPLDRKPLAFWRRYHWIPNVSQTSACNKAGSLHSADFGSWTISVAACRNHSASQLLSFSDIVLLTSHRSRALYYLGYATWMSCFTFYIHHWHNHDLFGINFFLKGKEVCLLVHSVPPFKIWDWLSRNLGWTYATRFLQNFVSLLYY